MTTSRERLVELTNQFVDTFNRCDLDAAMSCFADDAVYEDLEAVSHQGTEAIRAALTPFFDGTFGKIKFVDEDLIVDVEAAKVMASWRCNMQLGDNPVYLRGLDILHFNDDKLVRKVPYSKTKEPLFQS